MKQFNVTGMSCAVCSARVEKAVSKVSGVTSCSVSLLTNSMGIEGNASDEAIIEAVVNAGYGASLKSQAKSDSSSSGFGVQGGKSASAEDSLRDRESPILIKRLFSSIIFLIPLMYVSMGHSMWNWPLPSFFDGNHVAMGLVQLLLSAIAKNSLSADLNPFCTGRPIWILLSPLARPRLLFTASGLFLP